MGQTVNNYYRTLTEEELRRLYNRAGALQKLPKDDLLQMLIDLTGAPNFGFTKRAPKYKLARTIASMEIRGEQT